MTASKEALRVVFDRQQMVNEDYSSRLLRDIMNLQWENASLAFKNENLRRNFQLIEGKYKELRQEPQSSSSSCSQKQGLGRTKSELQSRVVSSEAQSLKRKKSIVQRREDENDQNSQNPQEDIYTKRVRDKEAKKESKHSVIKRKEVKCIEVVRKKTERAAIPGHTCDQCSDYWTEIMRQGLITKDQLAQQLMDCSRHKAKCTPPDTPAGFWDDNLSMPTPEKLHPPYEE